MTYQTPATGPTNTYSLVVRDMNAGLVNTVSITLSGTYRAQGDGEDTPTQTEAASTAMLQKIVTALDGHADLSVTLAERLHSGTQQITP